MFGLFGKVATPLTEEQIKYQNTIKGELEELMGTVICHSPLHLWDHDQKKLALTEKDLDPSEMYKKFYEKYMKNFKLPTDTDEFRRLYANNDEGGFDFASEKTLGILRGIGWDLIKQIGRKILSGDFNLTTVTMPIKVMVPISILQHICNGHFNFPLYFNIASTLTDDLERLKYVVLATVSCWYKSSVILKPLNPIWGETYEMIWEDGSHEYVEQTSHHPPCSNFLIIGPNNNYRFSGYFNFTSNAWINSMKLTNTGKRCVDFKDGTHIDFNYCQDQYSNTFYGNFRHENLGEIYWNDVTHGLKAKINLGGCAKTALSDYFEGDIEDKDGKVLCTISGSFLSHIDFDGKRYWDIRRNIDIEQYPVKNQIKSSSIYRKDSLLLYEKKLDEAQDAKTELEEIQRRDRRLRKAWKEYGSVESVKNEKKKVEVKKDTSNLYGEDKDEEAPLENKEGEPEKTEVLRGAPKSKKEEIQKEKEEETDDDTPEEEKLEE
jgi:hypothetical protein